MLELTDFYHEDLAVTVAGSKTPMRVLSVDPKKKTAETPTLIILQEIFGINHSLEKVCAHYASMGYHILCPDLFHHIAPNIRLSDAVPTELEKAFDLFGQFDVDRGIKDVQRVIDQIIPNNKHKKIGVVGYCLGGFLAYLAACRCPALTAAISYYGVHIHDHLSEAEAHICPTLFHIAEQDQFVPLEAQAKIIAHFKDHPHCHSAHYKGVGHAFARVDGTDYHAEQARIANERTAAFLAGLFE